MFVKLYIYALVLSLWFESIILDLFESAVLTAWLCQRKWRQSDKWADRRTDKQTDKNTDKQTDEETGRQTDKAVRFLDYFLLSCGVWIICYAAKSTCQLPAFNPLPALIVTGAPSGDGEWKPPAIQGQKRMMILCSRQNGVGGGGGGGGWVRSIPSSSAVSF